MENEAQVRQHLEAKLDPAEKLLACTKGATVRSLSSRDIYLGLTAERLIILPLKYGKPSNRVLSIWRENIRSIKWSGLWSQMKVRLAKDSLDISPAGGGWKQRIRELVSTHNEVPIPEPDEALITRRQIEQVETLREFDLIGSAHELIRELQTAPDSEANSAAATFKETAERRLALRVGSGVTDRQHRADSLAQRRRHNRTQSTESCPVHFSHH